MQLTASIRANVFDKIEMRTEGLEYTWAIVHDMIHLLVSSKVFDKAANIVIRMGPNTGWKLEACPKLR